MAYEVIHSLQPPLGRPQRRKSLDALVEVANAMSVGDAVVLTLSEANVLRTILAAQGFSCVTDGYRCNAKGKLLVFKLAKEVAA